MIRIFASLFNRGERYKFMDIPASHYATYPYDRVSKDGAAVGISFYPVYTSNFRRWISLAVVSEDMARPGTEVTITWGEPNGGSNKPVVERHIQTEVRATVAVCPLSESARTGYKT